MILTQMTSLISAQDFYLSAGVDPAWGLGAGAPAPPYPQP
jgi:hypothetical protein